MIRKKDLKDLKEDIVDLKNQINRLRERNAKIERDLTMSITEYSEIMVKEAIYALLRFLNLEIDVVKPNERFEIKPIKQKKGK